MADVVTHHIAHEEHGEIDAHHGIQQVQHVGTLHVELVREEILYLVNEPLEQQAGTGCQDTYHQGKEQHETPCAEHAAEQQESQQESVCDGTYGP